MRTTVLASIGVGLAMSWHIGVAQVVVPAQPLNDTGMRKCLNTATNTFSNICQGGSVPPGQDGRYGRDNTTPRAVDGVVGFSFAKVCNSGEEAGTGNCPANPSFGPKRNKWGCVKDNVTGLIWEVKEGHGLRGVYNMYTHLGNGAASDASGFIQAVNAATLCGASDWRLPTVTELQGIVNYSTGKIADVRWFPDSIESRYLTSESYAGDASRVWNVSFLDGFVRISDGGYYDFHSVRLVRSGQ